MSRLWTGTELKEHASQAEIQAGLDHLVRNLKKLRQQVRSDLSPAAAAALLEKIDQHVVAFNANAAALNEFEVRAALEERAAIIDALPSSDEDEASTALPSEQQAGH